MMFRKMTSAERREIASMPLVAVMVVLTGDRPLQAPVWFLAEEADFLVLTSSGSRKAKALSDMPWASLCIQESTPDVTHFLTVQGPVQMGWLPPTSDLIRRMAEKYLPEDLVDAYVASEPDDVLIRLRPNQVYSGVLDQ